MAHSFSAMIVSPSVSSVALRSGVTNTFAWSTTFFLDPDCVACRTLPPAVDSLAFRQLTVQRILNWCSFVDMLYPVYISGDGNCLMHAVSYFISQCTDSRYELRKVLHDNMSRHPFSTDIRRRWREDCQRRNQSIPNGGLELTESQWDKEWESVVNMASDELQVVGNTSSTTLVQFQYLDKVHVFALANILQRPIIVVGEAHISGFSGEHLEPNDLIGIYLPLLIPPEQVLPLPILLVYFRQHFLPLLSCLKVANRYEERKYFAVPLTQSNYEPLRIHFLLPEEEEGQRAYDLLGDYLILREFTATITPSDPTDCNQVVNILCAMSSYARDRTAAVARYMMPNMYEKKSTVDMDYRTTFSMKDVILYAAQMLLSSSPPSLQQILDQVSNVYGVQYGIVLSSLLLQLTYGTSVQAHERGRTILDTSYAPSTSSLAKTDSQRTEKQSKLKKIVFCRECGGRPSRSRPRCEQHPLPMTSSGNASLIDKLLQYLENLPYLNSDDEEDGYNPDAAAASYLPPTQGRPDRSLSHASGVSSDQNPTSAFPCPSTGSIDPGSNSAIATDFHGVLARSSAKKVSLTTSDEGLRSTAPHLRNTTTAEHRGANDSYQRAISDGASTGKTNETFLSINRFGSHETQVSAHGTRSEDEVTGRHQHLGFYNDAQANEADHIGAKEKHYYPVDESETNSTAGQRRVHKKVANVVTSGEYPQVSSTERHVTSSEDGRSSLAADGSANKLKGCVGPLCEDYATNPDLDGLCDFCYNILLSENSRKKFDN